MSSEKHSDLAQSLALEVRKFIAGVILYNEKVAAAVGLNGTDLQCLHVLQLQEAVTPGDLARWSGLTTGGVTVVLDRLERAGYIKRQPNPADRRSTIVVPVPSQLRKLDTYYRSKGALLMHAIDAYSERDLRVILEFFKKTNSAER
ncbi:MAG TPA: MarR family winged helix-turn-helix transcriptional regulator [Bryobacteraceae bacterium]|nr:MarR family winged helix-turn-helix transcriptional regulator [Bryobacteraceae bacterium]